MRIGFLFNHDALHQIAHVAPIAGELAAMGAEVSILTSSEAQQTRVRALLSGVEGISYEMLRAGRFARMMDRLVGGMIPFRRIAVLRDNLPAFAALDALVVPETTSALLKDRFGLGDLKLIYLPHGAGDRSVGFREVTRRFDLVLLSGAKVRDRMLAADLITPEGHAIVGYPKFDTVDLAQKPRFFDDDRPTVLYNPHFDPKLSSWYSMGEEVLRWFAGQDRFNLIFAPHVMLARRRVHASLEHHVVRLRREVWRRFADVPHILVDTGSTRLIDMSYSLAADIYLGDVSSQVYEWIARPRPCLFLDSAHVAWRDDPDFAHWELGEVVDRVAALPAALDRALADPGAFAERQERAFAATFSLTDTPSSRRAAEAIFAFLASTNPARGPVALGRVAAAENPIG